MLLEYCFNVAAVLKWAVLFLKKSKSNLNQPKPLSYRFWRDSIVIHITPLPRRHCLLTRFDGVRASGSKRDLQNRFLKPNRLMCRSQMNSILRESLTWTVFGSVRLNTYPCICNSIEQIQRETVYLPKNYMDLGVKYLRVLLTMREFIALFA